MTGSSGKPKEIVLGDELGDIAVNANGVRVEIHADGSVATYTRHDVDAFTNGAVHVHPAVKDDSQPVAKTEHKPGDRMADGTIYAGISPDTNRPMYAMTKDVPLKMKWKTAMAAAAMVDAHGHQDWRVPTKSELNMLYNYRAAIAGFDESGSNPAGWYWSSSQHHNNVYAWAQRFSDGHQYGNHELNGSSLRCVR